MQELKYPYPSVNKDGHPSYGGNQGWSHSAVLRKCGCGVVGGTDLLLYLHRNRPGFQSDEFCRVSRAGTIPLTRYNSLLDQMRKKHFFVIPYFGMNGLSVCMGLNHYFRTNGLPMRARWGVWKGKLWSSVENMLSNDLPVILGIGPNVPFFWRQHKLQFYVKTRDGKYQASARTKAHYVTITGMDERWLKISSWGRVYYVSREEYVRYVKNYSSYLVSNIVHLRPCKK